MWKLKSKRMLSQELGDHMGAMCGRAIVAWPLFSVIKLWICGQRRRGRVLQFKHDGTVMYLSYHES